MSITRASTQNRIGMRNVYRSNGQLGVYRGPAEAPPIAALFPTHGLGAIAAEPVTSLPARPFIGTGSNPTVRAVPVVLPVGQRATTIVHSGSGQSTTTPATNTASQYSSTPVTNPRGVPVRQRHQPQPSSSTQTGATPTTTSTSSTPSGTALTSGAASTAQAGTPVPANWPTNQAYTDSNGFIWTYTSAGGWQPTGVVAGSVAATQYADAEGTAAGTGSSVNVSTGLDISAITAWLDEQTIVSGIPNFFFVAGAGALALMLTKSGKR